MAGWRGCVGSRRRTSTGQPSDRKPYPALSLLRPPAHQPGRVRPACRRRMGGSEKSDLPQQVTLSGMACPVQPARRAHQPAGKNQRWRTQTHQPPRSRAVPHPGPLPRHVDRDTCPRRRTGIPRHVHGPCESAHISTVGSRRRQPEPEADLRTPGEPHTLRLRRPRPLRRLRPPRHRVARNVYILRQSNAHPAHRRGTGTPHSRSGFSGR